MPSESELAVHDGGIKVQDSAGLKVGILGAGMAGLYAALILDSLDLGYEILEASDRVGGRVATYRFQGEKYDYFDMGAMRFPFPTMDSQGRYNNGIMKRLAKLTDYEPLNEGQNRLRDSLIPYYYQARNGSNPGFHYFNGIREPISHAPRGPFGAQEMGVDPDYIRVGVDAIIKDIFQPFIQGLLQDIETGKTEGWKSLMDQDPLSIGAYLTTKYIPSPDLGLPPKHLPSSVINWCELLGVSIRDEGMVDAVLLLMSIAETSNIDVQWKCFEDGAETLPKKIEEYLNRKGSFVQLNKRVTAISQGHTVVEIPDTPDHALPADAEEFIVDATKLTGKRYKVPHVTVTTNGQEKHRYSHVISTLPPSVLHMVDMNDAGLNVIQKNALRSLKLMPAIKVAVLFRSNWWTTKLGIVGGRSETDLPIGMVVYPSHGVNSDTPSKVLISGFCYGPGADHLGSLATPQHQVVLRDLVLRNLAELHSGLHPDVTYEFLQDEFISMHVKDWHRDPYSMGAVAVFGPGRIRELHTSLTFPAAGKRLHFAGEPMSFHHGWIVGALDSSWKAVHDYLEVTGQDEKMKKFKALWGENSEWTTAETPSADNTNGQTTLANLGAYLLSFLMSRRADKAS